MTKQLVEVRDLGVMEYKAAWDYQEALLQENLQLKRSVPENNDQIENLQPDTRNYLLFVEHPAVFTLGKSGKMEHVLINEQQRKAHGVQFYQTNRGGDITFHGPHQIVAYPILDLEKFYTDIGRYLRELEEVVIQTLAEYGIIAGRSAGETGVWIDATVKGKERKICAMGVRCSRWVTMHGLALNVNTDLSYFNYIIPCGIVNKKVTSIKEELKREVNLAEVKEKMKNNFAKVFNVVLTENAALDTPQNSLLK